jgi:hypothetical protein
VGTSVTGSETFAHHEHAATWVAAIGGNPPVWDSFLAGYAAGVDVPFSNCWRDLAAAYPDAPALLSHRGSAEVWYRSMAATVLPAAAGMRMTNGTSSWRPSHPGDTPRMSAMPNEPPTIQTALSGTYLSAPPNAA